MQHYNKPTASTALHFPHHARSSRTRTLPHHFLKPQLSARSTYFSSASLYLPSTSCRVACGPFAAALGLRRVFDATPFNPADQLCNSGHHLIRHQHLAHSPRRIEIPLLHPSLSIQVDTCAHRDAAPLSPAAPSVPRLSRKLRHQQLALSAAQIPSNWVDSLS